MKKETKIAKFFSLLVDETSDISRQEQVSFALRFVNENCDIQERFLEWILLNKPIESFHQ